mmetsp:Transcript_49931/g.129602  ORF Transcript_49931/g.129602 Transcript_49931/m.129602 type:complete len:736 (+) Transcript_49931:2-2209(+)
MSADEKLDRSFVWKVDGNDLFKNGDLFKAADAYYHAVIYCRDLVQNPKYYPNLKHTEQHQKAAKDICESSFTNLALVQTKYARTLPADDPERAKVLGEAEKSASEALKINASNVKALFRRALARVAAQEGPGVSNAEGQRLLGEAKADLLAAAEKDPQNREARAELKKVQDQLRQLKREEVASEKRQFSFASTLAAVSSKEKDLLKDGSVRKVAITSGDGGLWLNEDWLDPGASTKCVVHVRCSMLSSGGLDGTEVKSSSKPVALSFILGHKDMHDGMTVAVKSMTVGEVASFTLAPSRMRAEGSLAGALPSCGGQASVWEVAFLKFVTWDDARRDSSRLFKIQDEGYGKSPEALSEVHVHWRVVGPTGDTVHSSRHTLNVGGAGGLENVEDEDKAAPVYILGETMWEPLAELCRRLRQGGVGELRMRQLPPLPEDGGDGSAASAKLSAMMSKARTGDRLQHCVVRAEVERVVLPLAGPDDPRWEGIEALVQERFRGEQLLSAGNEAAALARLQRARSWAERLAAEPQLAAAAGEELCAARSSIGWALACRAAPVLDLGTVTSEVMKAARQDLAEAEAHCAFLEESQPDSPGTRLLRAKILVAQDDDFAGAHAQLLVAQQRAPQDPRVQEELRKVKVELRKQEEEVAKAKVVDLRDRLKRARTGEGGGGGDAAVASLLGQLSETKVSWDTVMDTRIGVELKSCQEQCGAEVQRLCREILGKFKDQSKEQRPMWEA